MKNDSRKAAENQVELAEEAQADSAARASEAVETLGEMMVEFNETMDSLALTGDRGDSLRPLRDNVGKALDALLVELRRIEKPLVPKMVQQ